MFRGLAPEEKLKKILELRLALKNASGVEEFACAASVVVDRVLTSWREPNIDQFLTKKYISIVFASQNLSSPISMFGHTYLVAHNEVIPEVDATVVEFLADTSVPFGHMRAIFSNIRGKFVFSTFLLKQREYEEENRDLWVYQLNINSNDRQELVNKIKNNTQNDYPYTFIKKNCSHYILDLITSKNSSVVYTLPAITLRDLKESGYIDTSTHLKSLQKRVQATPYNYSLILNYQMKNEPDKEVRNILFRNKKTVTEDGKEQSSTNTSETLNNDPANTAERFRLSAGYISTIQATHFELLPAQRSFWSTKPDGLETGYLEVGKISALINSNTLRISQFSLLKLESFDSAGEFKKPLNRLFDLSYYSFEKWGINNTSETVLRWGWGYTIAAAKLKMNLLPHIGYRYLYTDGWGSSEFDFGARINLNFWFNQQWYTQLTYLKYWNTRLRLDALFEASLAFTQSTHNTWGINYQYSPSVGHDLTEIKYSHGF